jgi:hypothetical protein
MIAMTAVLQRWSVDCPFWPVDPTDFLIAVPRAPTPRQVGTVVWTLIGRSVTTDDLSMTASDAKQVIETYLTGQDEDFAPGGLRISADDLVVDPGCCVGLDGWRDWVGVIGGEVIYLGHDPDVLVEHRGPVLRVWKDKDQLHPGELPGSGEHIDIPRGSLPQLLASVHQDLAGFLTALHHWARQVAADLADPLTTAVDRRLQISAPLDI